MKQVLLRIGIVTLLLSLMACGSKQAQISLSGAWAGPIQLDNGNKLPMKLTLADTEGELSGEAHLDLGEGWRRFGQAQGKVENGEATIVALNPKGDVGLLVEGRFTRDRFTGTTTILIIENGNVVERSNALETVLDRQ